MLQGIPTYSMACFLLPKSLYDELEGIVTKFWWQKCHGKKGFTSVSGINCVYLK